MNKLESYMTAYYGAIVKELYTEKASAEVLEVSFTEIAEKITTFDPAHSTLFAWGFRIVRRNIIRKKTDLVLQELLGCTNPSHYRKQRAVLYA